MVTSGIEKKLHLTRESFAGDAEAVGRFVGLNREGTTVGARIEYVRPAGGSSAFVFFDPESIRDHIAQLTREGRDTTEEQVALSALLTAARGT